MLIGTSARVHDWATLEAFGAANHALSRHFDGGIFLLSQMASLKRSAEDMFDKEADWKSATKLICDLLRGSGSLAVKRHSSAIEGGERRTHFSSWQYSQTQAHGKGQDSGPRLFTLKQLGETLIQMSEADVAFAYETSGIERFSDDVDSKLRAFSAITATLVQLAIGDVRMSWTLVGLSNPRDLILWKMQYHHRDARL